MERSTIAWACFGVAIGLILAIGVLADAAVARGLIVNATEACLGIIAALLLFVAGVHAMPNGGRW